MERQLEIDNKLYMLIDTVITNSIEYVEYFNTNNRFEQYQIEDLMDMNLTAREFKNVRIRLELAICDHFIQVWENK